MPIFVATLLGGLAAAAGTLAGRVLLALGFGFVMFTGMSTGLSYLLTEIQTRMGGLSARMLTWVGVLQLDTCVTIIVSAMTVRLLLNGLTGGSIKRLIAK